MILSSQEIKTLIKRGEILITPYPEIKETSIKIHLSEKIVLKPKAFILSVTKEKIKLSPNIVGFYDGYAQLARKGVTTHLGSMFVDSDTNEHLTLEIFNFSDKEIVLEKESRCGQLILMEVK